ncbi:ABC transporter ATP-binding protein [Streptomyces sp. CA-106110]|uniref:ABC transporter ATP-binding protein n=1 Tax=Streptomyces sp. CA-106110 TaxID=3240044 RepID=UPI003D90C81E
MNAVETQHLGKRYRRSWALRDCTLAIPAGRVAALVGPNGAGKSTLLQLVVGLTRATSGRLALFGSLVPGSVQALPEVGFVAQGASLYPHLSVEDTMRLARSLNDRWDDAYARARLAAIDIPPGRKVGHLSGGQQSQVALTLALARRPRLLILDEPVSQLDPLARHEFMAVLMSAVAEDGISVLLSSHAVAELQRHCDYLVVLGQGRVQMAGDIDRLLAGHRVFTGPVDEADAVAEVFPVVGDRRAGRQATLLLRSDDTKAPPPGWRSQQTNVEELVLAYLRAPGASVLPGPVRHQDDERRTTA